jgi:copper resistance protein B
VETAEVQLRYSCLLTAFWELAVGVRYDIELEPARGFAVFAAHGLAPFLYEVDADAFISEDGDVSARGSRSKIRSSSRSAWSCNRR